MFSMQNEWVVCKGTSLFFFDSTTSSTSSGAESGSGSSNPAATLEPTERKLRDVIARLKSKGVATPRRISWPFFFYFLLIASSFLGDRASFESTIQQVTLPLESALIDPLPREVLPLAEARKMDLEIAVIMQVRFLSHSQRRANDAHLFYWVLPSFTEFHSASSTFT